MNFKYTIGAFLSLPLLPLIYLQGKRIKKNIPRLPEAENPTGLISQGNKRPKLEVLMLGESTFAGVGVSTHQEGFSGAYADQLSRCFETDIQYRVYAKSGYTAKRVTFKILPKVKEKHADIVLIGLGGNDAFNLTTPKRWRKDIDELISAIQKQFPSVPIVFCNLPPIKVFPVFPWAVKFVVGNLVEILGEELKALVSKRNDVYFNGEVIALDAWKKKFEIDGDVDDFFSDGLHPSKLTYQTWGREMANVTANKFLKKLAK